MTEKEFRIGIRKICKDKNFKKKHNLKSITIEFDEEYAGLTIKTKHFTWDVDIDYDVYWVNKKEINTDSFWYNVSLSKSSWEIIDDYLGDELECAWSDSEHLIFTNEQICESLMEYIIKKIDDEGMSNRFKVLDKTIKTLENVDPDDMWVIEKIAEKLS